MAGIETIQPDMVAHELRVRDTVEQQEDAVAKYGSFENYQIAMDERRYEQAFLLFQLQKEREHLSTPLAPAEDERVARDAAGSSEVLFEEDVLRLVEAERGWKVPAFFNPIALDKNPLGSIGLPQVKSGEAEQTRYKENLRYQRLPRMDEGGAILGCQVFDYGDYGWPSSQGVSARHVTVEEHKAILRRLSGAGLSKTGSPVPVVGRSLDKILADDAPQPPWIIDGILRQGGATLIYGGPGIGKSWLTYTLALGLATGEALSIQDATGKPVLTFGKHEGLRIGIIDGEMIEPDFGYRMRELISGLNLKPREVLTNDMPPIDPEEFTSAMEEQSLIGLSEQPDAETFRAAVDAITTAFVNYKQPGQEGSLGSEGGIEFNLKNIEFYTKTNQEPMAQFISIAAPEDREPIIRWAKRNKFDVLIMDNLSTLCSGLDDENSAAAFTPINDLIVSCKHENIAVVLLHHTNKSGASARGSSNLLTTFESSVRLAEVSGPKDGARFSVMVEKDRNMGRLALHKKIMTLKAGAWLIEEDVNGMQEDIVEALRSLEFTTRKELATYLKVDPSTITRGIARAEERNMLKKDEVTRLLLRAKELRENGGEPEEPLVTLDI